VSAVDMICASGRCEPVTLERRRFLGMQARIWELSVFIYPQ
jgi:hypothetical protein